VRRIDVKSFRVPGAAAIGRDRVVRVQGTEAAQAEGALCVTTDDEGPPRLSAGG
jgi:hypothetical protein